MVLLLTAGWVSNVRAQNAALDAFQLTEKHLAQAARGEVVVRALKSDDSREVAVVAAVLLPELMVDSRTVATELERLSMTPESYRFGVLRPHSLRQDLEALAIPPEDFRLIPRCQVGRCKIKLSQDAMDTLVRFDWRSEKSPDLANAFIRDWLETYLESYFDHGDSALVTYVDQESPAALASGLEHLMEHFGALREDTPSLFDVLQGPGSAFDTSESRYYWTIQESELRPVITVNHSANYHEVDGDRVTSWIATKQLYASHYYLAGFRIWYVVDGASELPAARPLLLYMDRSVFDGSIGGIRRTLLEFRMQQNVRERIAWLRDAVDREYGVNHAAGSK